VRSRNFAFPKRQYRSGRTVLQRHQHVSSYLALVVSGGHEEAGDRGCHRVRTGDVILHGAFEAHLNRYDSGGADVLDLALPLWMECPYPVATVPDADEVVRVAERDPQQALELLFSVMKRVDRRAGHWPQELAEAIEFDPHLRIDEWAREHGLADATVSRGFYKVFGLTPSAFRARHRARTALRLTIAGREMLSQVALQAGFCDQAHMTRAVHAMTGKPPGAWRSQVK
jgi:AraC-like DNA-binding protein